LLFYVQILKSFGSTQRLILRQDYYFAVIFPLKGNQQGQANMPGSMPRWKSSFKKQNVRKRKLMKIIIPPKVISHIEPLFQNEEFTLAKCPWYIAEQVLGLNPGTFMLWP